MKCLVCESKNIKFRRNINRYDIFYCLKCGLQFCKILNFDNTKFYTQSYIYNSRLTDLKIDDILEDWRYNNFFKLFKGNDYKLLDIGCGTGKFLKYANTLGYDVFGIDLDKRAIEVGKNIFKLKNIELGDISRISNLPDWNNFDIITLFDVLEHTIDPLEIISRCFKLLKNEGSIFITVPRLDRYPPIFNKIIDYPPHHLTLWTIKAITIALDKIGFKDIRIITKPLSLIDLVRHFYWNLNNQNLNSQYTSTKRYIIYIKKLIFLMDKFLMKLNLPKGHTLIAIAKK